MKLFASVGGYFALDIGTSAVRAVQLSGREGAWTLAHYGTVPIDQSSRSEEDEQACIRAAVTAVIGQSGIRSKNVILGLPSSKVFSAVVDMPDAPAKELAKAIERQMRQSTPDTGDVSVDWAVLGKSGRDSAKNEVLLASVAKDFIAARVDLVKGLGLSVVAVEPDTLAVARALSPVSSNDASVIVDIDDFATDIIVAYDAAPRVLCSLPIGMQSLVGSVSRTLTVEAVQATQFITKFGMQSDKLEGHVRTALEPLVDRIVSEVEKSLRLYKERSGDNRTSRVILTGYGAIIPELEDYLALKLGVPAELGDPWQKVNTEGRDRAQLQSLSLQFAVAIGLAQRGDGA